eukprot:TRINITY_DN5579_c0_g1_i1.p1 TRINITY_DN5579_c0_g1~~TRINITY_DN5579_c0_g1_i1.p1  ORF type:complete len:486 (+),score=186.39 TRINITY_DN5579_c0_g1_i1:114-1571(+)
MKFRSTRGGVSGLSFEQVLLAGFADDGGQFLPEFLPSVSLDQLAHWRNLSFCDLCFEISKPFIDETEVPHDDLRRLVQRSYATFSDAAVVPVVSVGGVYVAELFHGPTLAFKDIAMQVVGNLCEYFVHKRGQKLSVVVATSGDTGAAAIEAVRCKANMHVYVLYPNGRVSAVQERQMITVLDGNVHVVRMDGTSDDLDDVVKALFADLDFKRAYGLCTINSINWARIMLQTVHFFVAYLRVWDAVGSVSPPRVNFSIPTGAFGNGFAGFLAHKMGLPIEKLVLATNENDVLCRFITTGVFAASSVVPTVSPAIDIGVPYNIERLLFYLTDADSQQVTSWMRAIDSGAGFTLDDAHHARLRSLFVSASVSTSETVETIGTVYAAANYLLDPHSAVGLRAHNKLAAAGSASPAYDATLPCVLLATAHPFKFMDTIERAVGSDRVVVSDAVRRMMEQPETRFATFGSDKPEAARRLRDIVRTSFESQQ